MSSKAGTGPYVSVVTPVYNGADVIEECIESVIAQTHTAWEHVIVDNCSTDGTREIARRYAEQDERIRLVTPREFVGVVESGNRSLFEISPDSKYTKVLHADDWLFPECLERMVGLSEEHPNIGIVSAYRLEETRVTLTGLPHSISVIPGREMARSILLGGPYPQLFGSPSSLLIRSDLIRSRDPFYDVDFDISEDYPFTEDLAACMEILRDSDFGFVHQVLTFTRRHEHSPFSNFARLRATVPEHLNLIVRYGPVYLDRDEYQRILAVYLVHYLASLGRSLPRVATPDFRAYHVPAISRLRRNVDAGDVVEGIRLQLQRMRKRGSLRARGA
jgi:glycosyltransferase involved in cell wall biosynthesis